VAIKIDRRIVGYEVGDRKDNSGTATTLPAQPAAGPATGGEERPLAEVVQMHEKLERPEVLLGSTYKIKTPLSEHALYVTINDIVLNPETPYEKRRPFEIFINSKNMDHFQWIVALTRIVSAVFRKGGDVTFLVEELRSVFDPQGGYFKKGGKYMPSLVAEIGDAIETHMKMIGMIPSDIDPHWREQLEAKQREFVARRGVAPLAPEDEAEDRADTRFPPEAQVCAKCHTKAVVMLDNCRTCLNCGDSKCG